MSQTNIPINRKRGDLYPEQITILNKKTGLAENIAGKTFLLTVTTIAEPPDATTKLFQIAGIITDAANGVVEFTPTVDNADNVGDFFYDAQMVGPKETVMSGPWNMAQDRTKD